MGEYKRLLGLLIGVVLYGLSASIVQAIIVTEIVTYNVSSTTVGANAGVSSMHAFSTLDPFDSSLGQLDAVEVTISGDIAMSIDTSQSYTRGLFDLPLYRPYDIWTEVELGFSGVYDYFDMSTGLGALYTNTATGVGETIANTASYNLGFRIDESSELLGGYLPADSFGYSGASLTSVPFVSGDRTSFLDSIILSDLLLLTLDVNFTSFAVPALTPTIINTTSLGTMHVDYYYTPFDSPQGVPEPTTSLLLLIGLAGIVTLRRKHK